MSGWPPLETSAEKLARPDFSCLAVPTFFHDDPLSCSRTTLRPTFTGLMVAVTAALALLALAVRLPCWTIWGSTSSEIFWPAFWRTDVDADCAAESVAEPVSVDQQQGRGQEQRGNAACEHAACRHVNSLRLGCDWCFPQGTPPVGGCTTLTARPHLFRIRQASAAGIVWTSCASPSSGTPACGSSRTGGAVVLDPGVFTDAAALDGADAVLITHEHADHVHPDHLRGSDAPIWTIAAVERMLREEAPDVAERVTVVRPGDRLEVAGIAVEVVGEKHAVIHPDYDRFDNSGYLLEAGGAGVYHPGDALTPPPRAVDVLLAPVSAPWLKVSEAVDFVREVAAPTSLGDPRPRLQRRRAGHGGHPHGQPAARRAQAFERREPGEDL